MSDYYGQELVDIPLSEQYEGVLEDLAEIVRTLRALGNPDLDHPLDQIDNAYGDLLKIPKDKAYWEDFE